MDGIIVTDNFADADGTKPVFNVQVEQIHPILVLTIIPLHHKLIDVIHLVILKPSILIIDVRCMINILLSH